MVKPNINISDYRYERKFFITTLSKYEVASIVKLHPAIFSAIYHQRFVNNIYFDSYNLNNFRENVEGATDRIKIRIRWYGDLFGYIEDPILEIKIKKGLLGKKISIPIKPFNLTENTKIFDILKAKYLKEILMIDFESLSPSLLNRYSRKYYQSSDKKYRITIDNEQSFYLINKEKNSFLNSHNDNDSVILELKYNQDFDQEAGYITSNFPFRITKSSKYVSGIQKVLQVTF
ncbi:VTC domain-containing protein [Candidatus Methanomarinus sp.]|nr:VTC domain-containing protein [ANME-2 cluster archaeon]